MPLRSIAAERPTAGLEAWHGLREHAAAIAAKEPVLASTLHASVLGHDTFGQSLAYVLGEKLGADHVSPMQMNAVCQDAFAREPGILDAARADIVAFEERDPACRSPLEPYLFYKGFHALQAHRVAHVLWRAERQALALHIQSRVTVLFGVDIHPAARIGKGVMIDHATSVVIGETAAVGDECSLLHEVTLGGTGAAGVDRHPKVGRGVLIGAGAKVLGNITIGDEAKIAAGSVVLHAVPARCVVAGVPARPVGGECCPEPAKRMDHMLDREV